MNTKSVLFLACTPLLLAGCGNIEIPESIPTPTAVSIETTDYNDLLETSATPTIEPEALTCTALQKERDNLSEAITLAKEELTICETEKEQLKSLSATSVVSTSQVKDLSPLLKKYLVEVKQEEFKFDSCGALGTVTGKDWYNDFTAALTASSIPFSALERALEPTDFYSVCYSEEGKTALFLGASSNNKSEFHMIKYQFEEKSLQESILLGGTCEVCPTSFGKRFGSYITLKALKGNTSKEYYFYYDSNIIEPR